MFKTKSCFMRQSVTLLCTLVLTLSSLATVSAQRKLGFGAGLGASRLTGDLGSEGSFGLNYYLEGKYFLNEKLAVGLEYNDAAVGYASETATFGVSFYGNNSFFAKGEYFLTTGKVRPYGGLALGLARLSTPEITFTDSNGQSSTIESETKSNLAVSPRLGLMLGKFGLEFSYNLAGKTPKSTVLNVGTSDKAFNFYSINLKYTYTFEI
jgi:hypothetical protein